MVYQPAPVVTSISPESITASVQADAVGKGGNPDSSTNTRL